MIFDELHLPGVLSFDLPLEDEDDHWLPMLAADHGNNVPESNGGGQDLLPKSSCVTTTVQTDAVAAEEINLDAIEFPLALAKKNDQKKKGIPLLYQPPRGCAVVAPVPCVAAVTQESPISSTSSSVWNLFQSDSSSSYSLAEQDLREKLATAAKQAQERQLREEQERKQQVAEEAEEAQDRAHVAHVGNLYPHQRYVQNKKKVTKRKPKAVRGIRRIKGAEAHTFTLAFTVTHVLDKKEFVAVEGGMPALLKTIGPATRGCWMERQGSRCDWHRGTTLVNSSYESISMPWDSKPSVFDRKKVLPFALYPDDVDKFFCLGKNFNCITSPSEKKWSIGGTEFRLRETTKRKFDAALEFHERYLEIGDDFQVYFGNAGAQCPAESELWKNLSQEEQAKKFAYQCNIFSCTITPKQAIQKTIETIQAYERWLFNTDRIEIHLGATEQVQCKTRWYSGPRVDLGRVFEEGLPTWKNDNFRLNEMDDFSRPLMITFRKGWNAVTVSYTGKRQLVIKKNDAEGFDAIAADVEGELRSFYLDPKQAIPIAPERLRSASERNQILALGVSDLDLLPVAAVAPPVRKRPRPFVNAYKM